MAKHYDEIPEHIIAWVLQQKLFWVASAPLNAAGHVNISPKSLPGTFHVVDKNRVWYEDLTGSGAETIAHLRENGRITIMFNAFDGPPRIVRLWGRGTVYEFGTPEYDELIPPADRKPGSRSAIVVDVYKVGTSCGYGVPFYEFKAHRSKLLDWNHSFEVHDANTKGADRDPHGIKEYWAVTNVRSLDGLKGMLHGPTTSAVPKSLPGAGRQGIELGGAGTLVQRKGMREEVKLLAAFSAGLLAAAVYVKLAGLA